LISGEERSAKEVFESMTFKIDGMHCDGCARTIQSLLSAEPGVQTATVSFKDGEARDYDPQASSPPPRKVGRDTGSTLRTQCEG
jgi:copper chaperone CopZ